MRIYKIKYIQDGLARRYRKYIENKSRNFLQNNFGLWEMLEKYKAKSGSMGCEFANYHALYAYIRKNRPVEILECGTGISTIIMAYALMENETIDGSRAGHITSMEEVEKWHGIASELLPEYLKKYVNICLSPVVEDSFSIFRGKRYKDIPEKDYDFIFIDGPNYSHENGDHSFDFDFIHLMRNSKKPISGLVDKRLSSCLVYWLLFGSGKIKYDYVRGLGVIKNCSKFDLKSTTKMARYLFLDERLLKHTSSV